MIATWFVLNIKFDWLNSLEAWVAHINPYHNTKKLEVFIIYQMEVATQVNAVGSEHMTQQ